VPGAGDAVGGLGRGFGDLVGGQEEQERAVQGGGKLDREHVQVGGAEVYLAEQDLDVQLGHGGAGSGRDGLAAVQGGAGDVPVRDQEADPGPAVGDEAVHRGRAGAQRRRSGEHELLEGPFGIIQERPEDARPGPEPAEHRPLAQPGPLGQPVHGQLVRAVLGQHLAGGGQQEPPVARGVGAFGGFGSAGRHWPGQHGLIHGIHSTAGILSGVKSV
jgi:hypothetical protein